MAECYLVPEEATSQQQFVFRREAVLTRFAMF